MRTRDDGFGKALIPIAGEGPHDLVRKTTAGLSAWPETNDFTGYIALRSTDLLRQITTEDYGGFDLQVTQRGGTVYASGTVRQRTIEVECPYCADMHSVPAVPGKYTLACRSISQFLRREVGRPFRVTVREKRGGLFVKVVRS